jgi:predicted ATPase/class 3 adenylate cyclase
MAEQPQGTVSLLFSDIEGSTTLLRKLGRERYAEGLETHRRLLRKAFERHGGYEVDSEGDAFFVAFHDVREAVAAAAEAQRAVANHEWPDGHAFRLRIGIHTGEPLAVSPKYVGLDVHKAARIMAAAHGGQVLLSEATQKLVRSDLPEGVALGDLGEHRLKDLLQPEPLAQLVIEGLESEFPALKTLGNRPTNLPVQPNSLIGREREMAELVALLRDEGIHLLTLTGPGGTGKTRLGLQVAAELLEEFGSGVFFVSLAPIGDPDLVVPAIAEALALREVAGEQLFQTLMAYLREKQMLLVLDNFEQVIGAAADAANLLRHCPDLRLLVTSRERLRVTRETVYAVPPLQLPEETEDLPALVRNDAVALFSSRAHTATGRFALTEENASAVVGICRRLDGLPLAIELAAAHASALPPQALLERLQRRLPLLTSGARDAEERQRTLRRTIDWSYDLLSPEEQRLFARLAVFVDGCRIEAAEPVCDADADLGVDLLDGLTLLVEKSLVRQRADPDGQPRFMMFETIREFATERLADARALDSVRARHAAYYLNFIDDVMDAQLTIAEELARLTNEQANLRAALVWANEQTNAARLASAVGRLYRLWLLRGALREGLHWAEAALARREGLDPEARVQLLAATSELFRFAGDTARAKVLMHECLEVDRRSGRRARVTHGGSVSAHVLAHLAEIALGEEDLDQAHAYVEESLALGGGAWALASLGEIFMLDGNLDGAQNCFQRSLMGFKAVGHDYNYALTLEGLGEVARRRGELSSALEHFRHALSGFAALGDETAIAECLAGLAAVAAEEGQLVRAGHLAGAAGALRTSSGQYQGIRSHPDLSTAAISLPPLPPEAIEAGRALTLEAALRCGLGGDGA